MGAERIGADVDGLPRLGWTGVAGIMPLAVVVTSVTSGIVLIAARALPWAAGSLALAAVVAVGIVGGIALWKRVGAERLHARVAAAREAWAAHEASRGRRAVLVPDGDADPRDIALALPRGWRVVAARGRLRQPDEAGARVETWVLRASGGSQRAGARREVVAVPARTGSARLAVQNRVTMDALLVTPAWTRDVRPAEPGWATEVRALVEGYDDQLFAVTVGDDRVIVFAMDDPRPETALARIALARRIAALIG